MKKIVLMLSAFIFCFGFASCNKISEEVQPSTIGSITESVTETLSDAEKITVDKTVADYVMHSLTEKERNTTVTVNRPVQSNSTTKTTKKASPNTSSSSNPNKATVPVTDSWQPKEFDYYALSDINWQTSENINGLELYGVSVEKYHLDGYSFLITMANNSDNKYSMGKYKYFSTTYSGKIEKMINNQWVELTPKDIIKDDMLVVMDKNYLFNVTVTISHYMPELENGRYRIILPVYENESEIGNLTLEFNSTKFNAETARAGTKIENAISFEIFSPYSGIKYIYNPMKAAEREKITELYNSFEFEESKKPEGESSVCVKICDSKGKMHDFWVYSDGTIFINNSYFKTPNGQEMYNLLNSIFK